MSQAIIQASQLKQSNNPEFTSPNRGSQPSVFRAFRLLTRLLPAKSGDVGGVNEGAGAWSNRADVS